MWTVKARKKKLDGPLGCYNSLTDKHLARYFSNRTVRRHLIRAGLLTKEGSIVSDSTHHTKEIQQQRNKQAHEILADAIVQKTIELDRVQQAEIQHHLENMYKIEVVERVKSARTKSKGHKSSQQACSKLAPLFNSSSMPADGFQSKNSRWRESIFPLNYSLPSNFMANNSAKNSDEQPFRACHSAKGPSLKSNIEERKSDSSNLENLRSKSAGSEAKNSEPMEQSYKDALKSLFESSVSPYLLPVFSKYAAMSETKRHKSASHRNLDKTKRSSRDSKSANQYKHRRSIEEITAIDTYEQQKDASTRRRKMKHIKLRKFPESLPQITLQYRGATLAAALQSPHSYQEVTVMQQHCGGNSICVFKSQLKGGDSFSFTSRRHLGYPFSIIIFINGIQHLRVSTCCEYRHRLGYRLGGKRGQFILTDVQGNKPCFRCQVEESLGIKRPHHPKPPEYSQYLQKFKKKIQRSSVQKKLSTHSAEISGSAELQKRTDIVKVPPVTCNEENQSDSDTSEHSEILENGYTDAERIPSENDDQEVQEQLVEQSIDDDDEREIQSENEGDCQENEPPEEIFEVVNEEDDLDDHLKSLSYHPSGGSDGEDDIPCNETCMSFDYTADSDEEPVDETEHGKNYGRTSSFCRQKSLCSSEDAGEQDSNSSDIEESESKERRDSADYVDNNNVQGDANRWQNKLECPQSYSSSDEEEGIQQQVVTADIHINPSSSSTKSILQTEGTISK